MAASRCPQPSPFTRQREMFPRRRLPFRLTLLGFDGTFCWVRVEMGFVRFWLWCRPAEPRYQCFYSAALPAAASLAGDTVGRCGQLSTSRTGAGFEPSTVNDTPPCFCAGARMKRRAARAVLFVNATCVCRCVFLTQLVFLCRSGRRDKPSRTTATGTAACARTGTLLRRSSAASAT